MDLQIVINKKHEKKEKSHGGRNFLLFFRYI